MAEVSVENNGLINNGDGITLSYLTRIFETSYFSTAYALQNSLTEKKLYRKNYGTAAVQCLLDYLHVIPFLVHRKFLYHQSLFLFRRYLTEREISLYLHDRSRFQLWRSVSFLGQIFSMDSASIAHLDLYALCCTYLIAKRVHF